MTFYRFRRPSCPDAILHLLHYRKTTLRTERVISYDGKERKLRLFVWPKQKKDAKISSKPSYCITMKSMSSVFYNFFAPKPERKLIWFLDGMPFENLKIFKM